MALLKEFPHLKSIVQERSEAVENGRKVNVLFRGDLLLALEHKLFFGRGIKSHYIRRARLFQRAITKEREAIFYAVHYSRLARRGRDSHSEEHS